MTHSRVAMMTRRGGRTTRREAAWPLARREFRNPPRRQSPSSGSGGVPSFTICGRVDLLGSRVMTHPPGLPATERRASAVEFSVVGFLYLTRARQGWQRWSSLSGFSAAASRRSLRVARQCYTLRPALEARTYAHCRPWVSVSYPGAVLVALHLAVCYLRRASFGNSPRCAGEVKGTPRRRRAERQLTPGTEPSAKPAACTTKRAGAEGAKPSPTSLQSSPEMGKSIFRRPLEKERR